MTYLCFDLGLRNTGVAWADSVKLPQPIETIHHKNTEELLVQIEKIITKYNPDIIVLGIPPKGVIKSLSKDIKEHLEKTHTKEVYLQDEDFSSQQAEKKVIQTGKSAIKRRQIHHSAAAAVVLQDFLDQH